MLAVGSKDDIQFQHECPISGIAVRCNALTWAGQSSSRRRQRRAAPFRDLLVLADGRLSQPFLPGRSPAVQVSRARRSIFGETNDRHRQRSWRSGNEMSPIPRLPSRTGYHAELRSLVDDRAISAVLQLGDPGRHDARCRAELAFLRARLPLDTGLVASCIP
jgi:hypothetical protein